MRIYSKNFEGINVRDDIPILLNRLNLVGNGAEVGVQEGYFSQIILGGSKLKKLHLVDCWDMCNPDDLDINDSCKSLREIKECENRTRERFNGNGRVAICKGFSTDVSAEFEDGSLDFVYIDAAHSEESCLCDLFAWWPKVRIGGVFAGHDYLDNTTRTIYQPGKAVFGVVEAVSKFRETIGIQSFYVTPEYVPSWIFIKQ